MQYCFFEDDSAQNFLPLTLTRPLHDLRLGILTLGEKWQTAFKNALWAWRVPDDLRSLFPSPTLDENESTCWINPRFLPTSTLVEHVKNIDPGTCIQQKDTIIAACSSAGSTAKWIDRGLPDVQSLLVHETREMPCIAHLWDLFLMNEEEIVRDLERLHHSEASKPKISPNAILETRDQIFIAEGAQIEAGAILIAEEGPIYIGPDATVMAGAIIRGPVAVCEGSTIKMDAKIYGGTTIGPVCKVGGEVGHSIFHSYSNKGHDGFVGNSLIGQWCNIGADTNTSNLKNNYSTIRMTGWNRRDEMETGQQFLGTVMADHSKTAINSQLNTGTVCGVSCNLFAGDFPPKFIPSFSWVGSNVIQPFKIEKALEMMRAMMARRDIELTDAYETLMRTLFRSEHGCS